MNNKRLVIGVCGFAGSGKDTIADYLVNVHEFRRESFASSLKDVVSMAFRWDREMLEGKSKESRRWREEVDSWWAKKLEIPHLTPRWILQYWGTDVIRNAFHDNFWIASLENKLRTAQDDVVISDCRFPNEIKAIRSQGGVVIRVVRGAEPEWYSVAEQANLGTDGAWHALQSIGVHASETAWIGTDFDRVLDNNGTLTDLYDQVTGLVQDLRDAKADLAA
jgi:hypothetical protein